MAPPITYRPDFSNGETPFKDIRDFGAQTSFQS